MRPATFTSLEALVPFAKLRAQRGEYDGRVTPGNMFLMGLCTHWYCVPGASIAVIYTRDIGHHTCGWWKNPLYERCLHLSLSYRDPRTGETMPHQRQRSQEIATAFFGDDVRRAWIEGPASDEGKANGVWHYRVFCDPAWQPITPTGEVYSRDLTEAGWKSFSEIHGYTPAKEDDPFLLAASEGGQP